VAIAHRQAASIVHSSLGLGLGPHSMSTLCGIATELDLLK